MIFFLLICFVLESDYTHEFDQTIFVVSGCRDRGGGAFVVPGHPLPNQGMVGSALSSLRNRARDCMFGTGKSGGCAVLASAVLAHSHFDGLALSSSRGIFPPKRTQPVDLDRNRGPLFGRLCDADDPLVSGCRPHGLQSGRRVDAALEQLALGIIKDYETVNRIGLPPFLQIMEKASVCLIRFVL